MFIFKQKIAGKTVAGGIRDVEIMMSLKYSTNFWRTLEMFLIDCEINLILTWSDKNVLSNDAKASKFAIKDTEIYDPVIILLTQDSAKLLHQLKSGLKKQLTGTNINQKNTSSKPIDYLIDPSFQGVNRLFVLSFENNANRTVHTTY